MLTAVRGRLANFAVTTGLLSLAVRTRTGVGYISAQLLSSAITAANPLVLGAVVGAVATVLQGNGHGASSHGLLIAFGLLAGQYVARTLVADRAVPVLHYALQRSVDGRVRETVKAYANSPTTVGHLEDPASLDEMHLATRGGVGVTIGGAAATAVDRVASYLGVALYGLIIGRYSPLLAAGLVLAYLVFQSQVNIANNPVSRAVVAAGEAFRRASYLGRCANGAASAKELRAFGLGPWFIERFMDAQWASIRPILAAIRGVNWRGMRLGLTFGLLLGLGMAVPVYAAAAGRIGVGEMTTLLFAVNGLFGGYGDVLYITVGPAVRALKGLSQARRPVGAARGGKTLGPASPEREIQFDRVSFTYPQRPEPVFDGLDLTLRAGESVAIVGVNGAGKTTLVKLLAGLYEPSSGAVRVDGTALAELDIESWRTHTAVLFQDFAHFDLSASENVELGRLGRLGDHRARDQAARQAGAEGIIAELPRRWDTILSRSYEGGADLSGGQWQRVALARALFAVAGGARVLVLDEPTAALDVRAEAEIFGRFLDLTRGLTTILISHRFSTVRRADRIIVLAEGRVIEDGTHDLLLASGGTYARLFGLQAARFNDAEEPEDEAAAGV